MKNIGIIGGIGPESTIAYYRMLIQLFQERQASNNYPEIMLHSIDMTEMLSYVFTDELDKLVEFLKNRIEVLENSGAKVVAMASNTPHIVFDRVAEAVNVEMISIVEATCAFITREGIKKVGLLGTKSTMSKGFYQEVARRNGIDMVIPDEADQDYVHEKYMGELVFNEIKATTKTALIDIVNKLKQEENIEGIVLGGTELPLILGQEDFDDLVVFNTMETHVNAILDQMLSE